MHENGQRMVTRQYRDDGDGNDVLIYTTEVEYYSFLRAAGYVTTVSNNTTIQVKQEHGNLHGGPIISRSL